MHSPLPPAAREGHGLALLAPVCLQQHQGWCCCGRSRRQRCCWSCQGCGLQGQPGSPGQLGGVVRHLLLQGQSAEGCACGARGTQSKIVGYPVWSQALLWHVTDESSFLMWPVKRVSSYHLWSTWAISWSGVGMADELGICSAAVLAAAGPHCSGVPLHTLIRLPCYLRWLGAGQPIYRALQHTWSSGREQIGSRFCLCCKGVVLARSVQFLTRHQCIVACAAGRRWSSPHAHRHTPRPDHPLAMFTGTSNA